MKQLFRKMGALIIGIPILALGIILIPLPGPGILVCLIGLFILSREFDWADKYFKRSRQEFDKLLDKAHERADSLGKKTK